MKKLKRNIEDLTKSGVLLGVGAIAAGKTGISTAGFTTASSMLSPLGTVIGAGAVVRQVKKMKRKPRY